MTTQSELEIGGTLFLHPFAELVAELADACVSGSLRLENNDRKAVVYLRQGRLVFAASNARSARIFQIMLDRRRMTKADVAKVPSFANDMEFVAYLEGSGFLSKTDSEQIFVEQVERIVVDILGWQDAKWTFSPLRRVRDGLDLSIDTRRLLFDYGRCMSTDCVLSRFRSLDERFHRSDADPTGLALNTDEAFVLSRTSDSPQTIADLISISAMNESTALHSVYTLWLGGLVIRDDWQPALSPEVVAAMRGAHLALKQEAQIPASRRPAAKAPVVDSKLKEVREPEPDIVSLDEYLTRVENAETYYDVLGIQSDADIPTIKRAYFALAKAFHPDKFHSEGPEVARRVQDAFTDMMQAHEALKTNESRDLYDYRIRKELAARKKREAEGDPGKVSQQVEQAAEQFERGFSLFVDGNVEAALPFLARAAHYSPTVGRYRAYYGKALASDPDKRHKAEGEMQAALKLDPNNPTFRILLAEFFIQFNLKKRAEGELKRLLAVFPSNLEAQDLLASLQAKT